VFLQNFDNDFIKRELIGKGSKLQATQDYSIDLKEDEIIVAI